jgi:Protein of unknown function DUF262
VPPVIGLLNQVGSGEVVLPAIQRDFVWDAQQSERLLDSVMRGYPIGIALLWETYADIQYRLFVKDHRPGTLPTFVENRRQHRLKVVLDGQQRLQTLYVALFGTREGKRTYFDLLSGEPGDDSADERYAFWTLKKSEADQWIRWAKAEAKKPREERRPEYCDYVVSVAELFRLNAFEQRELAAKVARDLDLPEEDALRVELNMARFVEVLTKDPDILHVSVIDENLPAGSPFRKSEADVLEIFVRINREGTPLNRSDLIFSILKLNWKESAEGLPEFVASVNKRNSFNIDTDFVVRCLFAVSDLGTRLEIDLLRKQANVIKLQKNFAACCDAIRSAVDFVKTECRCESNVLIGGVSTLVPLVYYLFHVKHHEVPNREVDNVRSAILAFAFARTFSRFIDSRSGTFINAELKPLVAAGDTTFPLRAAIRRIERWDHVDSVEDLIGRNPRLALHIVQGLRGGSPQYSRNAPEIDHIFPRSTLRVGGVDEEQINSFANFWILAAGKNRNKSNRHPKEYFADVGALELKRALIDRKQLDFRRFPTFVRQRKAAMIKRISAESGLSSSLF